MSLASWPSPSGSYSRTSVGWTATAPPGRRAAGRRAGARGRLLSCRRCARRARCRPASRAARARPGRRRRQRGVSQRGRRAGRPAEAEHVVGSRRGDPVAEHAGHRGGRAQPVGRALVQRADGRVGQVLGHARPHLARGRCAGRGWWPVRSAARATGRGERPVRGEHAVEQGAEAAHVVGDRGPAVADELGQLDLAGAVTTTWSGCTPPNATPAPCAAATPSATRATVPAAARRRARRRAAAR